MFSWVKSKILVPLASRMAQIISLANWTKKYAVKGFEKGSEVCIQATYFILSHKERWYLKLCYFGSELWKTSKIIGNKTLIAMENGVAWVVVKIRDLFSWLALQIKKNWLLWVELGIELLAIISRGIGRVWRIGKSILLSGLRVLYEPAMKILHRMQLWWNIVAKFSSRIIVKIIHGTVPVITLIFRWGKETSDLLVDSSITFYYLVIFSLKATFRLFAWSTAQIFLYADYVKQNYSIWAKEAYRYLVRSYWITYSMVQPYVVWLWGTFLNRIWYPTVRVFNIFWKECLVIWEKFEIFADWSKQHTQRFYVQTLILSNFLWDILMAIWRLLLKVRNFLQGPLYKAWSYLSDRSYTLMQKCWFYIRWLNVLSTRLLTKGALIYTQICSRLPKLQERIWIMLDQANNRFWALWQRLTVLMEAVTSRFYVMMERMNALYLALYERTVLIIDRFWIVWERIYARFFIAWEKMSLRLGLANQTENQQ